MTPPPLESDLHPVERALLFGPLRASTYLLLAFLAVQPVLSSPNHFGLTLDWQFFELFDEVARRTVIDFHQLPLWNPYNCGGNTLIGNPQTTYLVPTFPLVLLFGTNFGERLSNLAVIVVACEGGFRLMRLFGLRPVAALLGAFAFPFYGRTFGWFRDGQYGLLGTTFEAWILYGYLRGLSRPVYLVLGGAFLAWMISFRGIQPGPQLAMALTIWALLEGRRAWLAERDLRRALWPLGALAILGAFGIGLSAFRMVPVLETVLQYQRVVKESFVRTISDVFVEIYAVPPGTRGYADPGYTYVGIATFLLFVASLLFARARRRAAIPLVVAIWFMVVSLGYHGDFSPYPWLHKLPLYRSLRNPTLYAFTGALFVVTAGCLALGELDAWIRARPHRFARHAALLVVGAISVGTAVELTARGRGMLSGGVFRVEPPARVPDDFRQSRGNRFDQPIWPYIDRGSLSCYDETPWRSSNRLRPDLPSEEYLADPAAGGVKRLRWTPNRIDLEVRLARPTAVLVNQNWANGWRASSGALRSEGGLLAVDLPAGAHRLTLSFFPNTVVVGLLVELAAIAAAAWMIRRDRRKRIEEGR